MKAKFIGVDEAGRGAWAGPIVAAAVQVKLSKRLNQKQVKDSKLLSAKQRQQVFIWIQENCLIGIGVLSNKYIDKHGLQRANVRVVELALKQLLNPNYQLLITNSQIVIDYIGAFDKLTKLPKIYSLHKKGESKYKVIAAASIVAKVYRDNLMARKDKLWPTYKLAQHKGYATLLHKQRVKKYGLSPIHRASYNI